MVHILQDTFLYAMPLMIVALGGVFAERSGIINLALEGEMIFGAFIGAIVGYSILSGAEPMNPQLMFIICMLVSAASKRRCVQLALVVFGNQP